MSPEGVFASSHKLTGLLQTQVVLSRSGWHPCALIPGRFAACDCLICKMCIEPVNGFNLITKGVQIYGGITNIQMPKFDNAPSIYELLADSGFLSDTGYKPVLSYCLKTQVMAALKSIDRDHFASVMRSSQPNDYHDCLTVLAVKAREADGLALASPYPSAHPAWRGSRSFIAFSKKPAKADNLVRLPVSLHSESPAVDGHEISRGAARVIDFQKWIVTKETRAANKDKMTRQKIKRMTMREKRLRILDLISDDDMDHQTLASILEFLESLAPDTESRS